MIEVLLLGFRDRNLKDYYGGGFWEISRIYDVEGLILGTWLCWNTSNRQSETIAEGGREGERGDEVSSFLLFLH